MVTIAGEELLVFVPCKESDTNWTLIQQRVDDEVNFDRTFEDYKWEFGSREGNFWIGFKQLSRLANNGNEKRLLIYMESFNASSKYMVIIYEYFRIMNTGARFMFFLDPSITDCFSLHTELKFATNDEQINFESHKVNWWNRNSTASCCNLNGVYRPDGEISQNQKNNIFWNHFRPSYEPLKYVKMAVMDRL